jgi:hypothetical protein
VKRLGSDWILTAEQHKKTFCAKSTDYDEKSLHFLIRSNSLTSVKKIAEGRNLGRCQVMRLGMVELQRPPSARFKFLGQAKWHSQFQTMPNSMIADQQLMILAQLFIRTRSARLPLGIGNVFKKTNCTLNW